MCTCNMCMLFYYNRHTWKMPWAKHKSMSGFYCLKRTIQSSSVFFLRFDRNGHFKFVPHGQTVHQELYLGVLKRLQDASALICGSKHYKLNNAPSHRDITTTISG